MFFLNSIVLSESPILNGKSGILKQVSPRINIVLTRKVPSHIFTFLLTRELIIKVWMKSGNFFPLPTLIILNNSYREIFQYRIPQHYRKSCVFVFCNVTKWKSEEKQMLNQHEMILHCSLHTNDIFVGVKTCCIGIADKIFDSIGPFF